MLDLENSMVKALDISLAVGDTIMYCGEVRIDDIDDDHDKDDLSRQIRITCLEMTDLAVFRGCESRPLKPRSQHNAL